MKRIKLKSISTIFLAGLVFVMMGCAAGEYAYDTWDADTNAYLDETEFDTAISDIGYYGDWDADDDTYLTENEWNEGVTNYFGDYDDADYGVFSDWDTDANGMLDDNEFGDGLYGVVDANDNDVIEENEYDTWYDDDFGV